MYNLGCTKIVRLCWNIFIIKLSQDFRETEIGGRNRNHIAWTCLSFPSGVPVTLDISTSSCLSLCFFFLFSIQFLSYNRYVTIISGGPSRCSSLKVTQTTKHYKVTMKSYLMND